MVKSHHHPQFICIYARLKNTSQWCVQVLELNVAAQKMTKTFYELLLYFGEVDGGSVDPELKIGLESLPHTSKDFLAAIFECCRVLEKSHEK